MNTENPIPGVLECEQQNGHPDPFLGFPDHAGSRTVEYDAYFGLGHLFTLRHDPAVFPVSPAGLALGYNLLRNVRTPELQGSIIDVGTGSGVQALLLRGMGAHEIVATDISPAAVRTAQINEVRNFNDSKVQYFSGNLFEGLPADYCHRFDLAIFNPPGWRSPSAALASKLRQNGGLLDLRVMFYGDQVLLAFLSNLPRYLKSTGRAIVGLNSLVGIGDVIQRGAKAARSSCGVDLKFKLLEKIEFPLLLPDEAWEACQLDIINEFESWRKDHKSTFCPANGSYSWYYEIVEVSVSQCA
jgi:release factor glutamine methyltransferase